MVKDIFKSGSKIILSRQNSILSAALVLMVMVLFSRVLGLVRDRLLAGTFFANSNQWQLDVYFAAFRIPDMIFQLLVLGALSAAFIPVYSSYLKKNADHAWEVVNGVMTLASAAFMVLALTIFIFSRPLSQLLAPNFTPQQIDLMVQLTRMMLISQFFFMISNFYTGVLQSHQRFLLPAMAPVMYNLGIIAGIIFLAPSLGIYGPTIGVVIGALMHLIIQYPLMKKIGFVFKPVFAIKNGGVRKIGKLMIPRTAALAVSQIELNVAVILASAMSAGSLSILNFAEHLQAVPVGLFGLTIGQAALPMLSKEADNEENNLKFKQLFLSSFHHILYFALPASVLLLVLRIPVVRIAFGAREFPWEATLLTGKVLAAFSISVAAQAVIQLLVRAFYALQDTVTPLLLGGLSVLLNVSLSLLFVTVMHMGVTGLGLAISLAGIFQALLLFAVLTKKVHGFPVRESTLPVAKMLVASFLTGIALWVPMRFLDRFILDTTRVIELVILTVIASASGFIVYILLSKVLHIAELDQFLGIFKRFGSWKKIFSETEEVFVEGSASVSSVSRQE